MFRIMKFITKEPEKVSEDLRRLEREQKELAAKIAEREKEKDAAT